MLKGLPASGKSTYAKTLVSEGYKRVNKDELRLMIDNGKWSKKNEEYIIGAEEAIAWQFLEDGFNVVVDDTNFAHEDKWKNLALKCGAEFEVKFFDIPINECVERDAKRGDKSVGGDVIFRMYYQYIQPFIEKPVYDKSLQDAYIVDIDGTLSHMKGRSPFEWKRVGEDLVDNSVADTVAKLKIAGSNILILSGRDAVCRTETEEWLKKNGIPFDGLYMRPEGDNRKDNIVKKELYENNIKGKYNILGVFDDRDQVVSLWRSLGLKCFQCDYGTF